MTKPDISSGEDPGARRDSVVKALSGKSLRKRALGHVGSAIANDTQSGQAQRIPARN